MSWRCHAHPPVLNGKECGYVNEDGAHVMRTRLFRDNLLSSTGRLEYCGKCGRTKKASDDRLARKQSGAT